MKKLNEFELSKIVENIIKNTLFENKIIRIVEERGMFRDYRDLINPIINYVNRYLKENNPNEIKTTPTKIGEYPVSEYIIEIPQYFFDKLTWIENKKLIFEIYDLDDRGIELIGVNNIIEYRSGQYNTSIFDRLTKNNKLEKFEMKIVGFSQNKTVFSQNIQSSLYHEFTHAFENHQRIKNSGENLYNNLLTTNYVDISNYKKDNNIFKFINYYILNQTELSANIASVYGDLERIKSIRSNYNIDMKKTDAYKNYEKIKNEYLPKLIDLDNNEWNNFKKQTFIKNINDVDTNKFKKDFITNVNLKLNDLFRGIGKVASQYYDDVETKNDFENTNISL